MKKVLIISFHHNIPEDIGSIRCRGLAKYLIKFGWEPIVLTASFNTNEIFSYEVHQTSFHNQLDVWKKRLGFEINRTVKKQLNKPTYKNKKALFDYLVSFIIDLIAYPDPIKKGWYPTAIRKAEEIISLNNIEAIISSFPPATCHLIAKELSLKYDIPWIADYRDLWTNSHYYLFGIIRRLIDTRLEKNTISHAQSITTVSKPLAEKLRELHKNKKIIVIENGFDPTQIKKCVAISDKFKIVYTGILMNGKRDPERFFLSLKELIDEKTINSQEISVDFYGDNDSWLIDEIIRYNLKEIVHLHGSISKKQSIQEQRESQILLLLTMNNSSEKGVYTGKLFDYLAAQRPILSIGYKDSAIKSLLMKTKAGVHVSEVDEIKREIKEAYKQYISNGHVEYEGINSEIDKYNHFEMAKKFSEVLNSLTH
jgi:hypothetical protein